MGLIDAKYSKLIHDAEALRSDSDYSDFYVPEKAELEEQLLLAKEFLTCVEAIVSK